MGIRSDEIEIAGKWMMLGGKISPDGNCQRIELLVNSYLTQIARDPSGWDTLYRDPMDGRYWELLYRQSELHGGGPPILRYIGSSDARVKYVVPSNPDWELGG